MSAVSDVRFLRTLADNLPLLNPVYAAHEARDVRAAADRLAALEAIVRQVLTTADEAGDSVRCGFCGWSADGLSPVGRHHAPGCRKADARALLRERSD